MVKRLLIIILVLAVASPLFGATRSDIRTIVNNLIAQDDANARTDTTLKNDFINWAAYQVSGDVMCVQKIDTVTLSLNVTEYKIDSGMILNGVKGVVVRDAVTHKEVGLARRTVEEMGRLPIDTLAYYSTWGHKIHFNAIYSDITDDTVFVYYAKRADEMTDDTNTCQIPDEYIPLVALKAAQYVYMNMRKWDAVTQLEQKYQTELGMRLQIYEFKGSQSVATPPATQ